MRIATVFLSRVSLRGVFVASTSSAIRSNSGLLLISMGVGEVLIGKGIIANHCLIAIAVFSSRSTDNFPVACVLLTLLISCVLPFSLADLGREA